MHCCASHLLLGGHDLFPGRGMSAVSRATEQFPALNSQQTSGIGEASCMHVAMVLSSCAHHYIQEDTFFFFFNYGTELLL